MWCGIIVPAGYDIITVIFMSAFSTLLVSTRLQQDQNKILLQAFKLKIEKDCFQPAKSL